MDLTKYFDNSEVKRINESLARRFKTFDNRPLFRIVWSNSIFENRRGTYRDFSESGLIFLREVTEVRRVRKYNYIHERWILEQFAGADIVANRETPDSINGDYVPIYVFEDGKGNFLPVNERAVNFLIGFMQDQIKQDEIPSQEYLDQKEIEDTVISMDTHPIFQTSPGEARNAVGYTKGLKGK